jgi:Caudovirus prohead serine protease
MSAGHTAHGDDVPAIDDDFYARVKDLVDACKRDRDHTIPWLANRSVTGLTVYIDVSVPKILPKTQIDTGETLPYHELGEWLGMNEGLVYDEAHATRGNPSEKRRVEELGGVWANYQAEMAEYIREVDDEAMTNVPADIDKRVFVDDDDKAALEAIIADNKRASTMERKFISGAVIADSTLGERQIRVVASDPTVDRAKDVMVPKGCVTDGYAKNNIFLADHDPTKAIGNAEIIITPQRVEAVVTFAPKGISTLADERCALYKAGVLKAVSVGFQPIEWEPIKDTGGLRYTKWELLELSGVAVPCNPNAITIERSLNGAGAKAPSWKVGASRNLPIDGESGWDSASAAKSVLDHAKFDTDKPDTAFARKAFLAYDASAPEKRESYQFPFAKMNGGRLVAVATGIRGGLGATFADRAAVPDDVKKSARAVLEHYEAKMKGTPTLTNKQIVLGKNGKPKIKGLYACAQLAQVLSELGYIHDSSVWEMEAEQDASKLPAMLAGILTEVAGALVAMTMEETAELLAGHGIEVMPMDEAYVAAAPTPEAKALRAAFCKAGRVMSQANMDHLAEIGKCLKGMAECHEKTAKLHDDLHDTLVDMMDHGTSAGDHMKAMLKSAGEDDDTSDPDSSDQELAAEVAVRKREQEFLERSAELVI